MTIHSKQDNVSRIRSCNSLYDVGFVDSLISDCAFDISSSSSLTLVPFILFSVSLSESDSLLDSEDSSSDAPILNRILLLSSFPSFVMLNVMNDALEDLSFSNSSNKDKSPNTSVAILDRKFKDCLGVFGTLPNSPCQQRCICTGGAKNVNFWKTVKPFFSKKCNSGDQNIILCEDNKIINDTCEVSEKFNTFFSTVADEIGEDIV